MTTAIRASALLLADPVLFRPPAVADPAPAADAERPHCVTGGPEHRGLGAAIWLHDCGVSVTPDASPLPYPPPPVHPW